MLQQLVLCTRPGGEKDDLTFVSSIEDTHCAHKALNRSDGPSSVHSGRVIHDSQRRRQLKGPSADRWVNRCGVSVPRDTAGSYRKETHTGFSVDEP